MKDPVIQEFITFHTSRARIYTKFNLYFLGIFISSLFMSYPIIVGVRELPYGIFIPYVDCFKTPAYEIIYAIQVYLTVPACCIYIPYSNFFTSCTNFGLIQIKTLKYQIRNIDKEKVDENFNGEIGRKFLNIKINRKLDELVLTHKNIIKYVAEFNSLVAYNCLVELISFGLILIALLFLIAIVSNVAKDFFMF